MFPFEFVNKVVNETVVEVLATQVSVTGSSLDLEDTFLNGQERDIESSSTKIEDEDIAFSSHLLVKTVGDSSGSRFVDDTKDIEARNDTRILGGLTLSVVEV